MRPEYYADLYRRYQSYVKQYGEKKIFKIACGPGTNVSDPNYNWTEVLMKNAGAYMDGLSLHYYTTPSDDWNHKGSATDFTREEYEVTLRKALFMETLLAGHGAVMDKYDPEKRVALVVDEWGTWYDVEPGTNPGFLYQQSTRSEAFEPMVLTSRFISWVRKSSRRPTAPSSSRQAHICAIWDAKRESSSSMAHLSAKIATSCASRCGSTGSTASSARRAVSRSR